MTSTTAAPPLGWRVVTVVGMREETPSVRSLVLEVPAWPGHLAGQYVNVRRTGEDTKRTFSIASPPEDELIELTIEELPAGEVSSYLCGDLHVGDRFELRGPMGSFVWRESDGGPLLFIAGGSGIAPLMSMLRHRDRLVASGTMDPTRVRARLLASWRTGDDIIYREELAALAERDPTVEIVHTLTRDAPPDWRGLRGRVDRAMLSRVAWPPSDRPKSYICGPRALVDSAYNALVELGHEALSIRTERFGPTG
jgi:ferredoxin-NADP reductase